ncbi:hypothetical protein SIO70_11825 [Chitinophaga sancti]|uniref:hypothetical protein n=1 Tax=Chitinophaga sancti TaxID=1004 RepID=UPI002A757D9E|nr:hypothetical protein [Chitinophaga sancti]WPQ65537.1 hypothetical protein SIO70_11825 [Chitinophaga sancti]
MKEVNEIQRQQLVAPALSDGGASLEPTVPEEGDCTTRNSCTSGNSSIGGGEDILF